MVTAVKPGTELVWVSIVQHAKYHAEKDCSLRRDQPWTRVPTQRVYAFNAGASPCTRCVPSEWFADEIGAA